MRCCPSRRPTVAALSVSSALRRSWSPWARRCSPGSSRWARRLGAGLEHRSELEHRRDRLRLLRAAATPMPAMGRPVRATRGAAVALGAACLALLLVGAGLWRSAGSVAATLTRWPAPPALAADWASPGVTVQTAVGARYERAAERLRAFARTHPEDPRAEDALFLAIVAHRRAGRPGAVKEAAEAYLESYPDGDRRGEVAAAARGGEGG